jgi:WD40 repeat protein
MRPGSIPSNREETLELCDTSTGKVRHQLKHDDRVVRVAWAPDGATVAVGTEQEQVYLWDAGTGELRKRWAAPATWSLVFSPDGKTLATGGGDCTVQLWQVATGKLLRQLGKPLDHEKFEGLIVAGTTSIAFSPDGKTVAAAVASQNTLTLWNVASGKELCQCLGHPFGHNDGWIYALAFSRDGKTLFSGCQDRTIRLWDTATGKERSRLRGHRGAVHTLALSPDGARLASGSKDCTILIWDLVSLTK